MAREMKNSGIEWIGTIPREWSTSKLKYIGTLQPPCDTSNLNENSIITYTPMEYIKKGYYVSNTIPYGKVSSSLTPYFEGDIVLAKVTPCFENGNIAIMHNLSSGFGLGSSELYVIRAKQINSKYLFYWLQNEAFIQQGCSTMTGTGGLKRVSSSFLNNCPITIPTPVEQQAIADFLDTQCAHIDSVIEKTRAAIEEYKRLKQSVITQAVTKGIRPNREMKESGIKWIGEIPRDWNMNLIKRIANTCSGGTPKSDDQTLFDGDINWICSYDLKERPIIMSGRTITQKGADSIAGKMLYKGTIVVAMYGGAGTIGNSGILECKARTNQAICSIKFDNKYITDYYGFYYILSIRKFWMIFAVGTRKDPNISQDIVKKMPCIIPPITEQSEIVAYLDEKTAAIDSLIQKKEQLISELEAYKKSLIYEYVTGKKEVV